MSLAEVKDAVYRDYYSDMSREDFETKLELVSKQPPDVIEEYSEEYRHFETGVEKGDLKKIAVEGVPAVFLFTSSNNRP